MSIQLVLRICAVVYLAAIGLDLLLTRRLKRFLLELLVLIVLVVLDALITNALVGHVAFGEGTSSTAVVLIMFVGVLLGIGARYVFYLKGTFSWLDLLKPVCISPIVLLPLISSVQSARDLQPIQVISSLCWLFKTASSGRSCWNGLIPNEQLGRHRSIIPS